MHVEMTEPTLEELKKIEAAGDAWSIEDFILPDLQEEDEEERPRYSDEDRFDDLQTPITYNRYLSQLMSEDVPVKSHKVYAQFLMMKGLVKLLTAVPGGSDSFLVTFGECPPASSQVRRFVEEYWFEEKRIDRMGDGEPNQNWSDFYTPEQILEKFYDEVEGAERAVALMIERFCEESRELMRAIGGTTDYPLPDEENWYMALYNPYEPVEAAAKEYSETSASFPYVAKMHGVRHEDLREELDSRGIPLRPEGKTRGDLDQAIADYVIGASLKESAKKNGVSRRLLGDTLQSLGLTRSNRKAD